MSVLPDELWGIIMESGIVAKTLNFKDLCCMSITCRRLRRLSDDDSIWLPILLSDFPSFPNDFTLNGNHNSTINNGVRNMTAAVSANGRFKNLYKIRYEKDGEKKYLAHRRVVLRIESGIAEHLRKIQEIELHSSEERDKMEQAIAEIRNLRRVRHASTALNVWQPEVIRGRQQQIIQQCNVPVDLRINSLEMELSVCKHRIVGFQKALIIEKTMLDEAKGKLASVKYHPLHDVKTVCFLPNEHRIKPKKFKHS